MLKYAEIIKAASMHKKADPPKEILELQRNSLLRGSKYNKPGLTRQQYADILKLRDKPSQMQTEYNVARLVNNEPRSPITPQSPSSIKNIDWTRMFEPEWKRNSATRDGQSRIADNWTKGEYKGSGYGTYQFRPEGSNEWTTINYEDAPIHRNLKGFKLEGNSYADMYNRATGDPEGWKKKMDYLSGLSSEDLKKVYGVTEVPQGGWSGDLRFEPMRERAIPENPRDPWTAELNDPNVDDYTIWVDRNGESDPSLGSGGPRMMSFARENITDHPIEPGGAMAIATDNWDYRPIGMLSNVEVARRSKYPNGFNQFYASGGIGPYNQDWMERHGVEDDVHEANHAADMVGEYPNTGMRDGQQLVPRPVNIDTDTRVSAARNRIGSAEVYAGIPAEVKQSLTALNTSYQALLNDMQKNPGNYNPETLKRFQQYPAYGSKQQFIDRNRMLRDNPADTQKYLGDEASRGLVYMDEIENAERISKNPLNPFINPEIEKVPLWKRWDYLKNWKNPYRAVTSEWINDNYMADNTDYGNIDGYSGRPMNA